jgi:hypothetical protein
VPAVDLERSLALAGPSEMHGHGVAGGAGDGARAGSP